MQERRRFLTVIGAGVATAACGSSGDSPPAESGAGGSAGSGGGLAGAGGSGQSGAGGHGTAGQSSAGQGGQAGQGQGQAGQGQAGQGQAGQGGEGGQASQGGQGGQGGDSGQAGGGSGGATTANCATPPAGTSVGPLASYAAMGLHKAPKASDAVLIGRDADGLYALTSLCTHELCNMAGGSGVVLANGIRCSCHSSVFSANGVPTAGPAKKPLAAYALALCADGNLYVDKTMVVPATQRLPA